MTHILTKVVELAHELLPRPDLLTSADFLEQVGLILERLAERAQFGSVVGRQPKLLSHLDDQGHVVLPSAWGVQRNRARNNRSTIRRACSIWPASYRDFGK